MIFGIALWKIALVVIGVVLLILGIRATLGSCVHDIEQRDGPMTNDMEEFVSNETRKELAEIREKDLPSDKEFFQKIDEMKAKVADIPVKDETKQYPLTPNESIPAKEEGLTSEDQKLIDDFYKEMPNQR